MSIHTSRKHTTANSAAQAVRDGCEVQLVDELKVRRAARNLEPASAVLDLADTFKLLGDPTRLKIVLALSREELCVCDLASVLGASQSAVSHSLRLLRQLDIVRFRRVGKCAYYTLDDEHIGRLLTEGFRHVNERA
jgi:DNA-binding transcriptional ArsR family regulator